MASCSHWGELTQSHQGCISDSRGVRDIVCVHMLVRIDPGVTVRWCWSAGRLKCWRARSLICKEQKPLHTGISESLIKMWWEGGCVPNSYLQLQEMRSELANRSRPGKIFGCMRGCRKQIIPLQRCSGLCHWSLLVSPSTHCTITVVKQTKRETLGKCWACWCTAENVGHVQQRSGCRFLSALQA